MPTFHEKIQQVKKLTAADSNIDLRRQLKA